MSPKTSNNFALLGEPRGGSGGDSPPAGARSAKKMQRAKEKHRERKALDKAASLAASPFPSPRFFLTAAAHVPDYDVMIDEKKPNTVVVVDLSGAEYVTLHFENFEDLFSADFKEFVDAAVVAVVGSRDHTGHQHNDEVASIRSSSSVISDTESVIDLSTEEDFFDQFESAVIEREQQQQQLKEEQGIESAGVFFDEDYALALRLQEEEDSKLNVVNNSSSSTSAMPHQYIDDMCSDWYQGGEAIIEEFTRGVSRERDDNAGRVAAPSYSPPPATKSALNKDQFPKLPPASPQITSITSQWKYVGKRRNGEGVRRTFPTTNTTNRPSSAARRKQLNDELEASGYRKHTDLLADHDEFLNSYGEEAISARQRALKFAQEAALREEETNRGCTTEELRNMMSKCNLKRTGSAAGSSCENLDQYLAPHTQDNNNNENTMPAKHIRTNEYSGKSIRKLVNDMIEAGWRPVQRTLGKHHLYERYVGTTGKKQIMCLPCTPSDVRTIKIVQSTLHRMDREAASIRAAAVY